MKNLLNSKVLFILILLSMLDITIAQSTKRAREKIAAEQIDNILLTIEDGLYEVFDVVDIDSLKGDMRYYLEPIEDPYGTLGNCFVFTTIFRDEAIPNLPEGFNENFDENFIGDRIGVYDFSSGNILWMSEPIIAMSMGRLFTTRDINDDGEVDILTVWGDNSQEMWIYSWNGSNGERINDVIDDYFSVITGKRNAFILFDAEGDGILEIKNLQDMIIEPTWSWNGELYGDWLSTPKLPETTLWPRNIIEVDVKCKVSETNDSLYFNYIIENGTNSKQRINNILINVRTNNYKSDYPDGWVKDYYSPFNLKGWRTLVLDHKGLIWPGNTGEGFTFISDKLVGISRFFIQGENQIPYVDTLDNTAFIDYVRDDIVINSVKGLTITPTDSPDSLVCEIFIDTLLSYTTQSFDLGWITNQTTADKYDSLFNTAKTLLEGNHIPWVDSTLHTVLEEVDEDSSGNITSEAYGLLRYNTEYLLKHLPEVIPPILTSISPGLTFTPSELELSNGFPEFTVTATGEFFTDSSVVYFNGQAKSTNHITDTILTFQLNADDITDAGDYPVWVSNYGSVSDTLLFTVADSLPQPVTPVCNCIESEKIAFFGYTNDNNVSVYIPVSDKNYFNPESPGPGAEYIDRGQPTIFLPGTYTKVFDIEINEPLDDDTWILDGDNAEPNSRNVPPCE